jgi:hypothetical protein
MEKGGLADIPGFADYLLAKLLPKAGIGFGKSHA